jgi:hypothetical protein
VKAARQALALAGIAMGAVAAALNSARMGWAAIALLLGSLILRLADRRRGPSDPPV